MSFLFSIALIAYANREIEEVPEVSEVSEVPEVSEIVVEPPVVVETVEERIVAAAKKAGISSWALLAIARCESGTRQFNPDGSVLRGRINSKDVGLFQINEYYHLGASQKLGYNIYTIEGNIGYAIHLIKTQGYRPWIHSNNCHGLL